MGFGKLLLVEYNNLMVGHIDRYGFAPLAAPPKFIKAEGYLQVDNKPREIDVWLVLPVSLGRDEGRSIFINKYPDNGEASFEDIFEKYKKDFLDVYQYSQTINELVTSIFVDGQYWGISVPAYQHPYPLCVDVHNGIDTFAKYGRKIDVRTDGIKKLTDNSSLAFYMGSGNFLATLYINDKPMFNANLDVWNKRLNIETIVEALFSKTAISYAYTQLKSDEVMVVNKHLDNHILYGYSIDRGLRIITDAAPFITRGYLRQPYLSTVEESFFGFVLQKQSMKKYALESTLLKDAIIELAEIVEAQDTSQPHSIDFFQLLGSNEYVNGTPTDFGKTLYEHYIKRGF